MPELWKHRLEKKTFAHDFTNALATGESLSGTPTVAMMQLVSGAYQDVSTEFPSMSPTISGKTVQYTPPVATGTNQDGGDYLPRVECDTDQGRHLVGLVRDTTTGAFRLPVLRVVEEGDPNAP